jgi:hypothetical protein
VLKRDLQPMEHTALDLALDLVVAEAETGGTVPLLGEIAHTLGSPKRLDRALGDQAGPMGPAAQDLAHALRRLVHAGNFQLRAIMAGSGCMALSRGQVIGRLDDPAGSGAA